MATAATIAAKLTLEKAGYDKGLDDASRKSDAFSSDFSNKMSNVGLKMAAVGTAMSAAVTTPIILAFKSSLDAASNLSESANAVNVVFGTAASTISEFGENAASAVGLSTREFNQLSSVTGAFLTNLGYGSEEAAKKTIELTKRASDMASVFNVDVGQALQAIQSGLKGEMDPLEQFGVKLNAAAIEAKAMAMGLAESTKELTDNDKAQASLALIMEQTDKLAGDFQNTIEGVANSTKVVTAKTEDASAALGERFIPYQLMALDVMDKMLNAFKNLTPEQQKMVGVIALIVAGLGPLILILGSLITSFGVIAPVVAAVAGFLGGPLVIALVVLTALVGFFAVAWANDWWDIRNKTDAASVGIVNTINDIGKCFKILPAIIGEALAIVGSSIQMTIDKAKTFLDDLGSSWENSGGLLKKIVDSIWIWIQNYFFVSFARIVEVFKAFQALFEGDWYGFGEHMRNAWDMTWKFIGDSMLGAKDLLTGIIQTLIADIVTFFITTDWIGIGKDILYNLWVGYSSLVEFVTSEIGNFVINIANRFTSVDWVGVGKDILYGIGRGISQTKDFLKDEVYKAAKAALDSAKGFLGIHSPSAIFAEVGKNMMFGWAQGIKDFSSIPVSMTTQTTSNVISAPITSPSISFGNKSQGIDNSMLEQILFELRNQPDSIARAVRSAVAKAR